MQDPETIHDWKPTHPTRPAFVVEAQEAARRAWQRVDDVLEEYQALRADLDTMNAAKAAAIAADTYYQDVYSAWQRGDEASIACTCGPTGDTCDNCRNRKAAQPDGAYSF